MSLPGRRTPFCRMLEAGGDTWWGEGGRGSEEAGDKLVQGSSECSSSPASFQLLTFKSHKYVCCLPIRPEDPVMGEHRCATLMGLWGLIGFQPFTNSWRSKNWEVLQLEAPGMAVQRGFPDAWLPPCELRCFVLRPGREEQRRRRTVGCEAREGYDGWSWRTMA
ncbi:hypothetical protein E2C01_027698 [Portunus trituberculatus]|uniref:Uncharacterized protein n=1 Tax=Portunus trituberculatus TaxID=210409 RepID=A0A5B7EPK1_PORTR|nr:hypothetical protein [Portunus trituberculatus]